MPRPVIAIVGSSGQLARALATAGQKFEILQFDRAETSGWLGVSGRKQIDRTVVERLPAGSTVFITAGVTDPRANLFDLRQTNVNLPVAVIEALRDHPSRIVTFGTAMEHFASSSNEYVRSKRDLGVFIENCSDPVSPVHHVRLHTLFGGGPPRSHMFLGQIAAAIQKGERFAMTAGTQLREYHQIEDVAHVLVALFVSAPDPCSLRTMDLSHGRPVCLSDLASRIFQAFSRESLLDIGSVPLPEKENFDRRFPATRLPDKLEIRGSINSVIAYLRRHLLGTRF